MEKFKKYIGKYNLILLISNSQNNPEYLNFKEIINENKKEFDKKGILLKKYISSKIKFQILVFNKEKNIYKSDKFINPLKLLEKIKIYTSKNNHLSLYSDYHPDKSKKGLGFRNKEVAKNTLRIIKNEPLSYQKQVVLTMYNRAKYHPNQTHDMKNAMKIFKKWLDKNIN